MAIEVMKKVVVEDQNPKQKLIKKKLVIPMELRSDAEQTAFMKKASAENKKNIEANSANAQYFLNRDKKSPK